MRFLLKIYVALVLGWTKENINYVTRKILHIKFTKSRLWNTIFNNGFCYAIRLTIVLSFKSLYNIVCIVCLRRLWSPLAKPLHGEHKVWSFHIWSDTSTKENKVGTLNSKTRIETDRKNSDSKTEQKKRKYDWINNEKERKRPEQVTPKAWHCTRK